ncbi:MAG: hypothetical protein FWG75_07900 [Cystobacterineae bacterium]|nr:hypothetical protein [Cystobacterineae bacterium]
MKCSGLKVPPLLAGKEAEGSLPGNVFAEASAEAVLASGEAITEACVAGEEQGQAPAPAGKPPLRESLNRLDTQLCFAMAREDLALEAQLLQQRREMVTEEEEMEANAPDKLLPTPALQSKKYTVELEMARAQLQPQAQPSTPPMELWEALERELNRRIPGRRAQKSKEEAFLRALSNSEFLEAYRLRAQHLYAQAHAPETPYEDLLSSWEKWHTCSKEAHTRFGAAWLWQYI